MTQAGKVYSYLVGPAGFYFRQDQGTESISRQMEKIAGQEFGAV